MAARPDKGCVSGVSPSHFKKRKSNEKKGDVGAQWGKQS